MKKTLFIIYSIVFLCGMGFLIELIFGVSPFKFPFVYENNHLYLINPFIDWMNRCRDFQYNRWAINSWKTTFELFTFLLFFPLWSILWFILVKKSKILKKLLNYHPFKKASVSLQVEKSSTKGKKGILKRPPAMPQSHGVSLSTSTEPPLTENETMETSLEDSKNVANLDKSYSQYTPDPETRQDFIEIAKENNFETFDNVAMAGGIIPLSVATDELAFLITFLNEDKEWIADETITEDGNEPTWFSSTGSIVSPVYQLSKIAKALQEEEPNSQIIPVVCLKRGSILNLDTIVETWDKMGCYIIRTPDNVKNENLMTFQELMSIINMNLSLAQTDEENEQPLTETLPQFTPPQTIDFTSTYTNLEDNPTQQEDWNKTFLPPT